MQFRASARRKRSFMSTRGEWNSMAKVGYARVSTEDQRLDLQLAALRKVCDRVVEDQGVSGSTNKRPGLISVLRSLKPGDTLIVWRLDRLGRSIQDLIYIIEKLGKRQPSNEFPLGRRSSANQQPSHSQRAHASGLPIQDGCGPFLPPRSRSPSPIVELRDSVDSATRAGLHPRLPDG